jgi:hypothetical protein
MNTPYKRGQSLPPELPLGRFIPPIPGGMVSAWCQDILTNGEWVVDPFGFNPMVPIEIAQSGHPVLVAANNPIHAFVLKVISSAPQEEEFVAALQDLAVAEKGDERMEPYIRSFYQVNCLDCQQQIEADAFLWKKGADQPYASIVECPFCGARGEQIFNQSNLDHLKPLPSKHLHVARALNRIADINDPFRGQVENALSTYPTRPLIILQTLINRLESLEQTPRRRELLIALILSAADHGNTLWSYPTPRERPRQIVVPSVYQEKNLWKILEESIATWQVLKTPIPISIWQGKPEQPQGIYLFQGRFRELGLNEESDFIAAVISAIPRPNQAFWTLSALWSGWLWGRETLSPIRQVLSRQRYDWNWHANALSVVFDAIQNLPTASKNVLGLIAENEPMLLLATLLAANQQNFRLIKFAQSVDDQIAQCFWGKDTYQTQVEGPQTALATANESIREYLRKKGEPAAYQQIHAAAITELAHQNSLALDIFVDNPNQAASETQKWLETLFEIGKEIVRVGGGGTSIETGDWWLAEPSDVEPPLIDRVEEHIIRHLVKEQKTSAQTLKDDIYQNFTGIFTPEDDLILNCLDSYADLVDPEAHMWQLRESEQPSRRKSDIALIQSALEKIGEKLNYRVTNYDPMLWTNGNESLPSFSIQVFSSAIISKHISQDHQKANINLMVMPEKRMNLLAFKQQRNPILKGLLSENYLIVQFSLIRDLQANPLLTRELFFEQIQVDPPEYRSSQLALF